MSSYLHELGITLKTTQPRTVWNVIKMRINLEISTENGQFQLFVIICLVLLYDVNYRFNQLYPLTPLMDK